MLARLFLENGAQFSGLGNNFIFTTFKKIWIWTYPGHGRKQACIYERVAYSLQERYNLDYHGNNTI